MTKARSLSDFIESDGSVTLVDNQQIKIGTGNDANIKHDGFNTKFTHTGTGGLYLGADTFALQNGTHDENFILMADNGAVTLYYDNSAKLATTSSGVNITGTVDADDLYVTGGTTIDGDFAYFKSASTTNASLTLRKDSSGADSIDYLQLRSDGNTLIGKITGAGVVHSAGLVSTGSIQATTATFTDDVAINNGSPELYFGTTGAHYNWRLAAQESVDAAFEISVGAQDTDYGNDSYSPVMIVKNTGKAGFGSSPSNHTDEIITITTPASGGGQGLAFKRLDSNSDQTVGTLRFSNNSTDDLAKIQTATDGSNTSSRVKIQANSGSGLNDVIVARSNGYVDFTGASDVRVTFGTTGTAGNNDSNWIRGEGSSLAFNAASANHKWEIGGTHVAQLNTTGFGVGVGTGGADTKLHVKDAGGIELRLEADSNNSGQEDCFIRFYTDGKTQEGIIGMDNNNSSTLFTGNTENAMVFGAVSSIPTIIATAANEKARFMPSINTAYTPDGLWNSNATPHFITCTGAGGLYLGYKDHGSGLYSAAVGLGYDGIDGLGNTAYVNGFEIKDISSNDTTHLVIETDGDIKNTNNSYGSLSDERIKSDIKDANSQWDDIKALKIRNYKLATQPAPYKDKFQIGVIAQELEAAGMNGLIKESDPDNKHIEYCPDLLGEKVKSVKYSVLYIKAIKALQEAMERIEALETKVSELEG